MKFFFLIMLALVGCSKSYLNVTIPKKAVTEALLVTNIQIIKHQIVVTGKGLKSVKTLTIKDGGSTLNLAIETQNSTSLVANTLSHVQFAAGKVLDFVFTTANASATFTVTISLCDTCDSAHDRDVLTFDQTNNKWIPASINGLSYKGVFDAGPGVDPVGSPAAGDYYVIGDAGSISGVSYAVGDWIVYNHDSGDWEKVAVSTMTVNINKTTVQPLSKVRLYGANATNYVELTAPVLAGNTTYTFPATDGTSGQVLSTNSSGVLSWITPATSGVGTVTSVTSANTDIGVTSTTSAPVLTLNSGTTANKILKLNGSAQIPAVDGSLLTSLTPANLSGNVPVTKGGTGLAAGTSGGIPYFNSGTTIVSSAALAANAIMLGGGAGSSPATMAAGTAGQILTSAGASAPAWITSLPIANGGTGATTLAGAKTALGIVDAGTSNITTLGTITTGTWSGTTIAVANGGTGATSASGARTNLGLVTGSSIGNIPVLGANMTTGSMCTNDLTLGFSCNATIPSGLSADNLAINKVHLATTANITLTGTKTIDGVAAVAGNRILVKNQTTASDNGVYIVAGGAWSRATDLDSWTEASGYKVQVAAGNVWEGMTFSSAAPAVGTIGSDNIFWNAEGSSIGDNNYNTVLGLSALNNNTGGYYNVGIGAYALQSNTTGSRNVAMGKDALSSNTTASYNIAVGDKALLANTSGGQNVAVGSSALASNTTASYNVGIGANSLTANVTGAQNVAVGSDTLSANIAGDFNTAIGNNVLKVSTGSQNTGLGESALTANTTGIDNTSLGYQTLYANTTGESNSALGIYALFQNTTGGFNIGIGRAALYENLTGSYNTAVGIRAIYQNQSGDYNVAVGEHALYGNISGSNNTALGNRTLANNTTGFSNIAVGNYALAGNNDGYGNVSMGGNSLIDNISGTYNVGIGYGSLLGSHGDGNIAIGFMSGENITTGGYNAILGSYNGSAFATLNDHVALSDGHGNLKMLFDDNGDAAIGGAINSSYKLQVTGNINATGTVSSAGATLTSDRRLKKDIKIIPDALEKLFTLSGVSYNWNHDFHPELNLNDRPQLGVIAQDVERVFPQAVSTNSEGIKSVAYNMLIAPIIESIKTFYHQWFDDNVFMKREIASVKRENDKLKRANAELQKDNQEIKKRLQRIENLLLKKN